MRTSKTHRVCVLILFWTTCLVAAPVASGQKTYGPGVTDTEIKIGQTMPYSGPVTASAMVGKAHAAYFNMINERGGINGRKIRLTSLDDGYNPAKTVEQTRKLVEQEDVLLIFGSLGTASNSVIQKYLNAKKIPQLLITSIGLKWNDPRNYPWTMAFLPSPRVEVQAFLHYLVRERSDAKIAVLYQNDDFGKDYLRTTKDLLGDKAARMMVAEASYEVTDPSIDSQIISLKASGADTLLIATTPKFGAFAVRKAYDIAWRPLRFIASPSTSIGAVLTPAGLEKSSGLFSSAYLKDPADPIWQQDTGVTQWHAWMKRYHSEGDASDWFNVLGYSAAQLLVEVLRRCGDDLTRENVMKQATSLKDVDLTMLLPGIRINTSPSDYQPIKQARLQRFDGNRWVKVGK
jgi:branched-chain amino acid transport system substrate-binding protein